MNKLLFAIFFCIPLQIQAANSDETEVQNSPKSESEDDFDFSLSKVSFGIHGTYFKPADAITLVDDLDVKTPQSMTLGYGLELGVPVDKDLEIRFAVRTISISPVSPADTDENKSMYSLEAIQTFDLLPIYFVGGMNYFDYMDNQFSLNIGTGFRYSFSDSLYSYLESKLYFNVGDSSSSFAANFGVVYQFGVEDPVVISADEDGITEDSVGDSAFVDGTRIDAIEEIAANEQVGIFGTAIGIIAGLIGGLVDLIFGADDDAGLYDGAKSPLALEKMVTMKPFQQCDNTQTLLSAVENLLYFDNQEHVISIDNTKRLDCIADLLTENLAVRVYFDGYLSEADAVSRRLHLSHQRVLTIVRYLIEERGIDKARIRVNRHDSLNDFDISRENDQQQGDRRVGYHFEFVE